MTVVHDFSHLSLMTAEQKFYLQALIVPQVTKIISQIKTQGFKLIPVFNSTTTNCTLKADLIANYSIQTTAADLLIFFTDQNSTTADLTNSIPCGLDFDTNRTTIGIISLNVKGLSFTVNRLEPLTRMLLKEHLHLMAMNSMIFPYMDKIKKYFVVETSPWNSKSLVTRVSTPTLVALGMSYFGCSNFTGLYLEDETAYNNGKVFWEKLLLGNELMVADNSPVAPLSLFTLAFLNDTSWYQTDPTSAEALTWGYQKGCAFIAARCGKPFTEYCSTEGIPSCTSDHSTKSFCRVSKYSNGCLISNWMDGGLCPATFGRVATAQYESGGPNSRCLVVRSKGMVATGCYQVKCVANYLSLTINGNTYTCGSSGNSITIESNVLEITCPNITEFCNIITQASCPNDCSGVGVCKTNRLCNCHPFFIGDSCNTKFQCNETVSGPTLSVKQCENLTQFNQSTALTELGGSAGLPAIFAVAVILSYFFG
jgi:hypothetical protein